MKRRQRLPAVVRFAGRMFASLIALLFVTLVGLQFFRVIGQNVALAHELRQTDEDVSALQLRREQKIREVRRLESAEGSVPEIHDRLRLVRPNEELIFVSPAPVASPTPHE